MASVKETVSVDYIANTSKFVSNLNNAKQSEQKFENENKKVQKELKETSKDMDKTGNSAKGLSNKLKGVIAGFSLMAGLKGVLTLTEAIDGLAKTSASLGITTEAFVGYSREASLAGVDTRTFTLATAKLELAVGQARKGNEKYTKTFDELGVSLNNTDGSQRSFTEVSKDTLLAIESIEDPTKRLTVAYGLLGKNALGVIKIMEGDGIQAFYDNAEAQKNSSIITDDSASSWENVGDQIEIAKNKMIDMVVSGLQPMIDYMADNPEVINKVAKAMSILGIVVLITAGIYIIYSIVMAANMVIQVIASVITIIATIVKKGYNLVMKLGLIKMLKEFILTVARTIVTIANTIVSIIAAGIQVIRNIVTAIYNGIVFIATILEWLFCTPIGLIVLLVIACIVVVVIIITKLGLWNEITAILTGVVKILGKAIEIVVGIFKTLVNIIKTVIGWFQKLLDIIGSVLGAVGGFFGSLFGGGKSMSIKLSANEMIDHNIGKMQNQKMLGSSIANGFDRAINHTWNISTNQKINTDTVYRMKKMRGY